MHPLFHFTEDLFIEDLVTLSLPFHGVKSLLIEKI